MGQNLYMLKKHKVNAILNIYSYALSIDHIAKISLLTTNLLIGEGQYIKAHNNKAKLADL